MALTLKIGQDEFPENPRDWDGNLGTMVCFHKRYNLGDGETHLHPGLFEGWEEVEKHLVQEEEAAIILPVSLYDHSGLSMSCGVASGWDCGQVGFIYTTSKKILETFGGKILTQKKKSKAVECLENEVKLYDMFLRGEVYAYDIVDEDGESVESCSGFFGREDAEEQAQRSLKYHQSIINYRNRVRELWDIIN